MLENYMVIDSIWWSREHPRTEEDVADEMTAAEEKWEADRDVYEFERMCEEDDEWTE